MIEWQLVHNSNPIIKGGETSHTKLPLNPQPHLLTYDNNLLPSNLIYLFSNPLPPLLNFLNKV